MNADPRRTWALDREIVLSRVIAAPRERVFQAWTDPKQIVQWFGPDGFKVESLECNVRTGGRWRFVYTGPDGTRYDNRMVFLRVEAPRLIEIEHGSDKDEDPGRFGDEIGLNLRREHEISEALTLGRQGREDPPAHAKIGRSHVRILFRSRKAEGNPAKVAGRHAECLENKP